MIVEITSWKAAMALRTFYPTEITSLDLASLKYHLSSRVVLTVSRHWNAEVCWITSPIWLKRRKHEVIFANVTDILSAFSTIPISARKD